MIKGINHITLTTLNVSELFEFYRTVLGFKPLCVWDKGAYFIVGDIWFCINYDENHGVDFCYRHVAFTIEEKDFDNLREKILQSRATIFKENNSEGRSLYFLDPSGNKLEIHVGNWQSRILNKKEHNGSWKDIKFFI